jgi:diguanylate cyclase (GGDEF)-like protein
MQVIMESEFNRAIRYKSELSCLLMDIDFFKEVNDTLGHPFGDFVLKEFATCLKDHVRYSDFLFRYGGEEFLVLLPQTDLEGAKFTAEKFRTAIESRPFRDGNRHTVVTVSIGVASLYVNHPVTYSEMISFADQALFMAKIQGRNRVIVYQDTLPLKDHGNVSSETTLQALKDKLSIVFLKIKKAAVSSLELLARDSDIPLSDRKKRLLNEYITMMGYHMSLSPSLVETFKLSTVIHECIHDLIQSLCEGPDDSLNNELKNSPLVMAGLIESLDVFSNERNIIADRKSTRLNSSHRLTSRMPSSA